MGVAHQIAQLYQVKMNAALDRTADPGELADYCYAQLRDLQAQIRRDVLAVVASREQAGRRVSALRRAADRLRERAQQAMLAGHEDLARQVLVRSEAIRTEAAALGEKQQGLLAEERKLAAAQQRLAAKIEKFGIRREAIKAAGTTARARTSIAEALAGISGELTDADLAARRAEDEAARLETRIGALDYPLPRGPAAISDERFQAELNELGRQAEAELTRIRQPRGPGASHGHRAIPGTASVRIEAWAPKREWCIAETVRGVVDSFASVPHRSAPVPQPPPGERGRRHVSARPAEQLLVAVIDEVIYRLDTDAQVPASVAIRPALDGGIVVSLMLVPLSTATITGAVPKRASLRALRCAPDAAGRWSATVTIDV